MMSAAAFVASCGLIVPLPSLTVVQQAGLIVPPPSVAVVQQAGVRLSPASTNVFPTVLLAGEAFTDLGSLLDTVPEETCNQGGKDCVSDAQRVAELKERQERVDAQAEKKFEALVAFETKTQPRDIARQAREVAKPAAKAAARAAATSGPEKDADGDKPKCFYCL